MQHPIWLLALGVILMAGSHLSFNVDFLAWFCSVPFLIYLSRTRGIPSRIYFILAMVLSWSLAVFKIISDPVPYAMIPLYSIPIALVQSPAYLLWSGFTGRRYSYLLFPSTMVVTEWMQYTFTPLGSWGAAAYTMVDHEGIMQIGSVFGLAGISFLIYLVNVVLAEWYLNPSGNRVRIFSVVFILAAVLIFGSLRVDFYNSRSGAQIKVAAVGTDSEAGGLPIPDGKVRNSNMEKLVSRTERAASAGARLVVWNEAAAVVFPDEEDTLKERLKQLSLNADIALIASYIVVLSEQPLRYENKYLMFLPDGSLAYTYHKHEPVPGEPAVKGKEAFESVLMDEIRMGGAICYDYDFPYLARAFGQAGADIVGLPSSDWRGIDPLHTKMAAMRAVEQGHSVLRSTRFGLSAAINPLGIIEAQMSSFNGNDRIMIAFLPENGIFTLYTVVGDLLIYLSIGFICLYILGSLVRFLRYSARELPLMFKKK